MSSTFRSWLRKPHLPSFLSKSKKRTLNAFEITPAEPFITYLPDELLLSIFAQYVALCLPELPNWGEMFDEDVKLAFMYEDLIERRNTPLALSQVCVRWRQLTHSTSTLWSTIFVVGYRDPSQGSFELFKLWLERSGSIPIDLVFLPHLPYRCFSRPPVQVKKGKVAVTKYIPRPRNLLPQMLVIALSNSDRWARAWVDLGDTAAFLADDGLLPSPESLKYSSLRTVWLKYTAKPRICEQLFERMKEGPVLEHSHSYWNPPRIALAS